MCQSNSGDKICEWTGRHNLCIVRSFYAFRAKNARSCKCEVLCSCRSWKNTHIFVCVYACIYECKSLSKMNVSVSSKQFIRKTLCDSVAGCKRKL